MNRVLWIHIDSYRPNANAPANRAFAFANYMSQKGVKVNIITIGEKDEVVERPEATVYYLKNSFHYKNKSIVHRLLDNLTFSSKTAKFIRKHKKEIRDSYYLVSLPEYISGLSSIKAKKYGAKLIVDIRDIWPEVAIEMGYFRQSSLKTKIFSYVAKKYYKAFDYLFAVSKKKTEYLKTKVKSDKVSKVFWIGNGFDVDNYLLKDDNSIVDKIDLNNKYIISYVGNIGKAQHLSPLIDYAQSSLNSNKVFIICGGGVDYKKYQAEIKDKNLTNVYLTGRVTKEQAIAVLKASNVAYVPLLTDKMLDSVPTKLFESLGYGVPVLLVAKGESADILSQSGLGVAIDPSDDKHLGDAFNKLENHYDEIMKNKDKAIALMKGEYSRQHYCELFYKIIFEDDLERGNSK